MKDNLRHWKWPNHSNSPVIHGINHHRLCVKCFPFWFSSVLTNENLNEHGTFAPGSLRAEERLLKQSRKSISRGKLRSGRVTMESAYIGSVSPLENENFSSGISLNSATKANPGCEVMGHLQRWICMLSAQTWSCKRKNPISSLFGRYTFICIVGRLGAVAHWTTDVFRHSPVYFPTCYYSPSTHSACVQMSCTSAAIPFLIMHL